MKLLFSIVFTIAALSGCAKKGNHDTTTMIIKDTTLVTTSDSLSYLALGDSYTIGQAVPSSESFPYQLSVGLTLQKHQVETPKIIAVTGWTTDNLISAIDRSGLIGKKYDFVTLLIGVNDQFQHVSQDNYKIKFAQVLNTAINFGGGDKTRVFVLSIPDYGVTPFAGGNEASIGPEIDQFNAINKEISTKAGVNYLDITDISRQAATDASLIANDGLHPSPKMYQLWVDRLLPMIVAKLKVN